MYRLKRFRMASIAAESFPHFSAIVFRLLSGAFWSIVNDIFFAFFIVCANVLHLY
jgi:hypothetical protein